MARQVLPIVGAVVGGFVTGWSPQGMQWGYAIGSVIGNAVDPLVVKGPKLGEAGLQTSAEGVFRPIVFGTGAVKGNVICRGNRQIKKKRERQGKGGPVSETERVYWTFAIRICEGPIDGIPRIWADEKLVYDITEGSTIIAESIEYAKRFRLYLGGEEQLPDPDLEAFIGAGNVPAYRGSAYIVFPNCDLTDTGERIQDFRFEVVSTGTVTPPVEAGKWIFGPVTQNGAAGGAQTYYRTTDDLTDWASGTLHALPAWLSSMARVSTANGKAWLHGSGNAAYSDDKGVTWTQCDADLPDAHDVTWNGDYYYCHTLRSTNGIAWTTIPNLTGTPIETLSRDSDGLIVCSYSAAGPAYRFETSADNGASWIAHAFGGNISYLATDGAQTQFTYSNTNGGRTFDFSTYESVSFEIAYNPYYGDGIWLRKGYNGRLLRSADGGENFTVTKFGTSLGSGLDKTVAYSGEQHRWVLANYTAGAPNRWDIEYSDDGGATWNPGDTLYGNGGNIAFIGGGVAPGTVTPDKIELSAIVTTLCSRAGLPTSRFDVSELTDMVDGLVLADDYTYADAIRTLMPIYLYGATEHDAGDGYKLHFPKHGKPVVTTLTIDDFVSVPDKTVRQDAYERPRVLHVHYQSPTVGYAPAKASPSRFSPDVKVVGEQSVQLPVAFRDQDEVWQRADRMLKIIWTGIAGEEEFSLPMSFLYLVPTDAVGISLRGQVRRMVFGEQSYAAGVIASKLVADRQGNYTSNLTGIPLPPPTPPPPSIVGPTLMVFGDWPALIDTQDRLGYTLAATGQTEAWHGAQIDRSTDGGANFTADDQFPQNSIMGLLLDDVTAASPYFTDTTNVLRIRLYMDDELESLSDAQFNSEGGAFALGTPDGWEICQYRDAEQDSNGDWLLSYLKRGQLKTDAIAHDAGATFVLLDTSVHFVDAVTAWLGTSLTHRAVSYGRSPDGVPTQTNTYTGASQREFPVASVSLSRAGDDITVSIIPRHRFGTEANPIRSINWERYTLEISDGMSVSVLGTTSDTFTFDASALSSPITVSVAQRNRLTGDGPAVSESIA